MNATTAPAGWHPDPNGTPGLLRWWDGLQWTEHTRPAEPAAGPEQPAQTSGLDALAGGASAFAQATREGSIFQRNSRTFITIALAALYIYLAGATGFVLIGFVPLGFALRAFRDGEQLAPLALVCAAAVIVVSISTLAHG